MEKSRQVPKIKMTDILLHFYIDYFGAVGCRLLQVFINTCLRQILPIRWPDRISNQELLRKKTGRSPSPSPSRTESGNGSGIPLRRMIRPASHAKPWIGTLRRNGKEGDQP